MALKYWRNRIHADIVLCNHMIHRCGERLSLCNDKGSKFLLCGNSREAAVPFQDR